LESFIGNHIRFIVDWGQLVALSVGVLSALALFLLARGRRRRGLGRVLGWAGGFALSLLLLLSGAVFARVTKIKPGATAILDRLEALTDREAPPLAYRLVSDGSGESLADLRGRVVLVNYWATWCLPCRSEMPDLDRLQRAHDPGELTVLVLSDEPRETLLAHDEEFGFAMRSGYLEALPWVDMGGERPVSFLVDREGRIREVLTGPWGFDHFSSRVARYL